MINRVDLTKSQRDKKVKENLKKTIIKIIKKDVEIKILKRSIILDKILLYDSCN